jgi:hypothetical protein
MRFEGTVCQHRSTIRQIRSEIPWWFGRDGLAPFSIEYVVAISVISKNGGRLVRTCLEMTRKGVRSYLPCHNPKGVHVAGLGRE